MVLWLFSQKISRWLPGSGSGPSGSGQYRILLLKTEAESAKQAEMSSPMTVTSAMDAPMSYSLGAMGPLLRKLDSLLPPDYRLPKLLKHRIQLLKADLEEISVALLEQSMIDSPSEMAKYWMNEVRELFYDIEDFIDNMMLTHADAKTRSVLSYKVGRVKIASLPKTLKPCTRAAKVAELSTLVREASERHDRYFDGCTSSSSRREFTGHGRIPALYAEAANNLVGIDDSKAKLIKWLTDEEEQQLKVVAVAGPAGVGKTTLAKQVYREVGEQFECQAFVRASRKPDTRRLLGGILSQVQGGRRSSDSCTVQNIIANLTKHLQDKRYVIVIDDLWETTAWDIVTSAFPEGYNCSRIITTTEIEVVALECCDYQSNNILKMKPLGGEDSGKLLTNLVFGPEHLCPEQFRVPSDIIITKCAGLPLATTFVTGLLTTQPNNPELWQHVQECLSSTLSTNSTMEETLQEILKLSYNSLPHYLKTCLIYLSVYPEGYTLWKIDLVKHWMAEGFIRAIEGTNTAEVADSYFDELVNRGMIQAVDINCNGEVLSCTMHHIVLDLIALESTEKRFITVLDYSETIREHYSKARRLSLHFSNSRYAMKPTGLTMSNVRSICFFGILECVPTIVGFKHLRILILEFWGDQQGSTTFNLTRICRLFQLRYLKILCDGSVEVELPTQMRMLQYLETLIIDAAVSAVPLDIVDLPGLLHLFLGDKADLPDKIGLLRSLRTLYCFDLGSNSEDNVLSLGDLMNLQDLHLTYCTEESSEHLKRNLTALASSLGKLVNLKSVTLAPSASGTAIYHDVWSSMSYLPVCLQRLEFLPPICIFSRFPKWIGQLRKLHTLQVVVNELLMEDMDILIGLPALTTLSLYVRRPTAESIIFRRGAFLGLKYFKYTCGVLSLAFQEEAFPNLQRLELSFNAHRGEQYDNLLLGIDNLLNVKEIAGTIGAAAGAEEPDRRVAESAFKDAIRKHPRFPSYDDVKRVDWVCEEYQITTQEKDSSSENHQILQKELKRKEGDSSDDHSRIVLKEIEEDSKPDANKISHFPTTGSIIPIDQMMTVCTVLDKLEKASQTVNGASSIIEDSEALSTILGPIKKWLRNPSSSPRELDFYGANQSLRIIKNLIEAGSYHSCAAIDDIISMLLEFTTLNIRMKLSAAYSFAVKCLAIARKLLDTSEGAVLSSYGRHWSAMYDLYSQILASTVDPSGRISRESTACLALMLSRVISVLKMSISSEGPNQVEESLISIIDHARKSQLLELLCECLIASGSDIISGSTNMVPAACEACKAIWYLAHSVDIVSLGARNFSFPLASSWRQGHSKLDGKMQEQDLLPDSNSTSLIAIFVKSFLASQPMQIAVYHCLHNGLESAIHASLQLIARACLLNPTFCAIMCGPLNSSSDANEVDYGGDGTIVSDMFSLLSLCGSYLNESKQNSNQKCKLSNPHALVVHCCLALATIAACLKLDGKSSASIILTSSNKKQRSRLSVLAHLSSADDTVKSCLQPHCASATLALSTLIALENGGQARSSLCETALALFPRMATLHTLLKLWLSDGSEELCRYNAGLLNLFGLRDGSIGLLDFRLKWGGPLAVEQACSVGIPQLLIRLLTDGFSREPSDGKEGSTHRSGLSPFGVAWTLSTLSQCLPGGVFHEILYKKEHVKLLTDMLSDMHLKALSAWTGLGGGKRGVRELINAVVDVLAFPFVAVQSSPNMPSTAASINSGFLLNMTSPGGRIGTENKEMLKTIEHNMPQYIQVLLEVGVPGCILCCLDYLNMEDIARPLAIVAKMVGYRPLALKLLREGLLNPCRVAKLLKGPLAKESLLDFLMIVSDLARMSKDFYEPIDKAGMVEFLKNFLSNEDPDIRAKACSAIGNMCRHSPYFYVPFASNKVIELVVERCSDPDKRTRKFACFAVGNAAYHNDMLYEELRRSIPQLTKLLLAPEEDKTKGNAAGALSNLVRNSDILCEDIVSQGAIQALLKMVSSYSTVALSPSRKDALTESPLRIVLFALRKMCDHTVCRLFLRSSDLLPIIVHLRQSPDQTISEYASAIASKAYQA